MDVRTHFHLYCSCEMNSQTEAEGAMKYNKHLIEPIVWKASWIFWHTRLIASLSFATVRTSHPGAHISFRSQAASPSLKK